MKINNYCIGSPTDLEGQSLDVAQYTLNGRQHPSKRYTLNALKKCAPLYSDTDLIVHYDYIYIVSRYGMFGDSTRTPIIKEVTDVLCYDNPRIKGLVMHTDFPIKSSVLYDSSKVASEYGGNLWNQQRITDAIGMDDSVEWSISRFHEDLKEYLASKGLEPKRKVYLENTVHLGPMGQGSVAYLRDLVVRNGWGDLLGVCVDMEHEYAATGLDYVDLDLFKELTDVSLMVHLNAIPDEVKPCNHKDRHSATTLSECSVRDIDSYSKLIDHLDASDIPWVREVYTETREREQMQLLMLDKDTE